MFERTVSPEDLDRLAQEHKEAEREYNQALTRLDKALPRPFEAGAPAAARHAALPAAADGVPSPAAAGEGTAAGLDAAAASLWPPAAPDAPRRFRWLHRLLAPVVGPAFERQERVNHALVAHLEQRAVAAAAARRRAEETVARIGTHLAETLTFQSRLLQYLQRITAFVDTKDREVAGLMRRINEDNTAAVAGAVEALETLAERQRGLRESVQVLHGASRAAARELHRLRERLPDAATGQPAAATEAAPADGIDAPSLTDAAAYAVFEDAFRGSRDEIAGRQRRYLGCFEGASEVLDIGCGRGEFLDLLRAGGIDARGIDANAEMVARCREQGLDATQADALAYAAGLPAESLGGLFSAQVVEHLEAAYLLRLLAALQRALRPGARIVLETINPTSWSAFFGSYIRDITHRNPLHPDTLGYLLRAHGFVDVEIVYSAPVPDACKLRRTEATPGDAALRGLTETFNANVDRLNGLLFAHQDYAAVGTRA